ncbi:MAG: DUF5611 family protein [Thermoplasmata archaeon]
MGRNRYDIKRGHFKNIEGDKLKEVLIKYFDDIQETDDKLSATYGAIDNLEVWVEGKTGLWVDMEMNNDVSDEVAMDTVSKWNKFLLEATGFNAKKRRERAKRKAKSD